MKRPLRAFGVVVSIVVAIAGGAFLLVETGEVVVLRSTEVAP